MLEYANAGLSRAHHPLKIEEVIFYPAVRAGIEAEDLMDEAEEDLMDEAEIDHASAKDLVAQRDSMEPGNDLYDARFTVLGEYIAIKLKKNKMKFFQKLGRPS